MQMVVCTELECETYKQTHYYTDVCVYVHIRTYLQCSGNVNNRETFTSNKSVKTAENG